MRIDLCLAAGLYALAAAAHGAPAASYIAVLNEARLLPAPDQYQPGAFEVVMALTAPQGGHKTLRISEENGMRMLLWPGEHYRVSEHGSNGARLEYVNPWEVDDLIRRQLKRKAK